MSARVARARKAGRKTFAAADLALAFRRGMREALTEDELIEVDQDNAKESAGRDVCHSHDHCDANMVMLEAYANCAGVEHGEVGIHDQAVLDRMNAAWTLAKAAGFSRRTEMATLLQRYVTLHGARNPEEQALEKDARNALTLFWIGEATS